MGRPRIKSPRRAAPVSPEELAAISKAAEQARRRERANPQRAAVERWNQRARELLAKEPIKPPGTWR